MKVLVIAALALASLVPSVSTQAPAIRETSEVAQVSSPSITASKDAPISFEHSNVSSTPAPTPQPIQIRIQTTAPAPVVVKLPVTPAITQTPKVIVPTPKPVAVPQKVVELPKQKALTCEEQGKLTAEDHSCVSKDFYKTCEQSGKLTAEDGSCVSKDFYQDPIDAANGACMNVYEKYVAYVKAHPKEIVFPTEFHKFCA